MGQFTKTVVGLDVHKETIAVSVLPVWSERSTETLELPNHPKVIEKLLKRVCAKDPAVFVYEAGPCGYEVYRQVRGLGEECQVVAPGLIPVRATDRVKTDRRDAEKLARLWRAGELTTIRVPTREEESARDLVRAREDVLQDRLRHRNRLSKFLLRQGCVFRESGAWGSAHQLWIKRQRFDIPFLEQSFEGHRRAWEEAEARLSAISQQVVDMAMAEPYRTRVEYLRCLKGIDTLSAITLVVEIQEFRRFSQATRLMKFTGLTPAEYSSGSSVRRFGIAKAGNAHVRRVLVEAAWSYRRPNVTGAPLIKRREGCPSAVVHLARKTQDRLHRRFHRLTVRGKPFGVAAVAIARELSGFVWAMAQHFPGETSA